MMRFKSLISYILRRLETSTPNFSQILNPKLEISEVIIRRRIPIEMQVGKSPEKILEGINVSWNGIRNSVVCY